MTKNNPSVKEKNIKKRKDLAKRLKEVLKPPTKK